MYFVKTALYGDQVSFRIPFSKYKGLAMKKNHEACPVKTTLQLIGNKWRGLIINELMTDPKRFSQLQKALNGITQKVLTANLRELEESGLLTRTVYAEVPPRVEYALTPAGQSLKPILDCMAFWGDNYQADDFCAECMISWGKTKLDDFLKKPEV